MLQTELYEPEEYLGVPGRFIHAVYTDKMHSTSYEVGLLPAVVQAADPTIDNYISQAVFQGKSRRVTALDHIALNFTDLDTYNVAGLKDKTADQLVTEVFGYCRLEGIPIPSVILFSGRGLQCKWLLTDPIQPDALMEWNQNQSALYRLFQALGADANAKDAARLLRLERTVNTKSGEIARVVYPGDNTAPARFLFQELSETLRELSPEPQPQRVYTGPQRIIPANGFTTKRLNWYHYHDIKDLWDMRGGVQEHYREVTLFYLLNYMLLAEPGRSCDYWNEAQHIAGELHIPGTEYSQAGLGVLYRKAQAMMRGEVVEFQGRKFSPLYTPRNQTLIERFCITPDEERKMRTIISRTEKERRRTEKRRSEGVKERTRFGDIKPWEVEGISRRTWYRRHPARQVPSLSSPVEGKSGTERPLSSPLPEDLPSEGDLNG